MSRKSNKQKNLSRYESRYYYDRSHGQNDGEEQGRGRDYYYGYRKPNTVDSYDGDLFEKEAYPSRSDTYKRKDYGRSASKGHNEKSGRLPTGPKGMDIPQDDLMEDYNHYNSKRQRVDRAYYHNEHEGHSTYYNDYDYQDPRYSSNQRYPDEEEEEDIFLKLSNREPGSNEKMSTGKTEIKHDKRNDTRKANTEKNREFASDAALLVDKDKSLGDHRAKFDFKYMVKCNVTGNVHERIQQVGEGTYGKVYKAKNLVTNELVALKKLRLEAEREGFPITSHREIGLLQSFDNENIVGLYEIMVEKNQVFMIFPYMNHDLTGILQQQNIQISLGEKKNIFHQLLKGVEYLHSKRVIHRDIKGSNILINNQGVLKITDFGLARKMKNINEDRVSPNYTNRVITLWYRPPEILLGSTDYGREVDIWGVGCILMELFTRRAIFQGVNEIDQLLKVYDTMGTITTENWPSAYKLPWYEILRPNYKSESKFKERYGHLLSPQCYDLATALLQMNPEKRITAKTALEHRYFKEDPPISPLLFLNSVKGEWHEFEAKQKRKMQQKLQQQQQQPQQQ